MSTTATSKTGSRKHRPTTTTVFAAAFLAGAAAAVGVNRAFDVHLAQSIPQVESEPIFVAIRSLPKGSPVTIFDAALKEWPKAMLPATALRADAVFDNVVLRHPLQEGQPILSLQLAQATPEPPTQLATAAPAPVEPERVVQAAPAFVPYEAAAPIPAPAPAEQPPAAPENETTASIPAALTPAAEEPAETKSPTTQPVEVATVEPEAAAATASTDADADVAAEPAPAETTLVETAPAAAAPAETTLAAAAPAETTLAAVAPTAAALAVVEPVSAEPTAALPTVAAAVAAPVKKPAEPTLAATGSEPTPAAPAVEPVDVTADVLAKAAARRAAGEPAGQQQVATNNLPAAKTAGTVTSKPTAATPAPAADSTPASAGQQVMRYLVVPERIALQVDHSFTRPQPPAGTNQELSQPTRGQGVRPLPDASAAAGRTRGGPSPAAAIRDPNGSRRPAQQLQAAAGSIPQASTRLPQQRSPAQSTATGEQQAAADPNDASRPTLRSMFPKLSAGLNAMGQEWRQFRDGSGSPASSNQGKSAAGNQSGQQRSAARPQQAR